MKKSDAGPVMVSDNDNNEPKNKPNEGSHVNLKEHPIGHPYGKDEDDHSDHSIDLAPLESSSTKSKRKKKKKKVSRASGDRTDESDDISAPSQKKKKKKKSKKTKEGKKSKKIQKGSQSSCSTSDFFSSISSLDTFAFDEGSHDSDQDSCYKSTGALTPTGTLTPVGLPKKKLVVPSSAPIGNERKKTALVPRMSSAAWRASVLSPKQSDFLSRREQRRTNMGADASMLNNTFHGATPILRRKMMATKIEKSLHDSLPDLFADSPGRNALPVGGSPVAGRQRLNSSDKKTWTPRAPTLTKRISSRNLKDELSGSSLHSLISGSDDSSDDPFKSHSAGKPASMPLIIPDLLGDSSDDDDRGLVYENNPFASPPGRTSKKKAASGSNGDNPFELVTPSRQTSTTTDPRLPSTPFVEHKEGEADRNLAMASPSPMPNMIGSRACDIPTTPGSLPVQELDDDISESSFATDGFLTPIDHGPLQKKIMIGNLVVRENNNTDDDERSLDVDDLFGLPPVPTPTESSKGDPKEESQEYSDSSFGFESPFGGMTQKSKKLTGKVIAPTSSLDMNQSFHDALSVDPFDSEESSVEPSPSQVAKKKKGFRGKVLAPSSFNEDMNRSFHDALSVDPFDTEELETEEVKTKPGDFSGKVISTTSNMIEEMNRSFHDALSDDQFESEEFKSIEFATKQAGFRRNVISTTSDFNEESEEEMKFKVAPESWREPESPAIGDTKKDGVIPDSLGTLGQQGTPCDDGSASSGSSFGPEETTPVPAAKTADIPKNVMNTSLTGFMNKNRNRNSSENLNVAENSKSSRRPNSLDKLKFLRRRSTSSLDKLKPPSNSSHRSRSGERRRLPQRESSIDDLVGLKKKRSLPSSKSWQFLRSAMSVVSAGSGSRSSEVTSTRSNTEPESPASNESWNVIHPTTKRTHRTAGRLGMDGRVTVGSIRRVRKSELSQSELGGLTNSTETRTSATTNGCLSTTAGKLTTRKKKKKKKSTTLGHQSEHSRESLASGKEGEKKGTKNKSRASKVSKPKQDDEFQDFVTERVVKPTIDDVVSC